MVPGEKKFSKKGQNNRKDMYKNKSKNTQLSLLLRFETFLKVVV